MLTLVNKITADFLAEFREMNKTLRQIRDDVRAIRSWVRDGV